MAKLARPPNPMPTLKPATVSASESERENHNLRCIRNEVNGQ